MIKQYSQKIRQEDFSSAKLAAEFLAQIQNKDTEIQSYISVRKQVVEEAAECDVLVSAGDKRILLGIPGALKDNFCVEGEVVTAGSRILEKYIAPYDATAVKRLREAGAVFLGKTNMDEFACGSSTENSAYQVTRNPHDHTRVAGGTSGGSAAAVAAGLAAFAIGSDTGGSIRQPAAFCGVVGLKPTYGRISRYGLIADASSFDTVGTLTRSVEDAAILLSIMAGADPHDATAAPLPRGKSFESSLGESLEGVRIGIPKEYFTEDLDDTIRTLLLAKVEKLTEQGAITVPISLPHTRFALPTYYILQPAELSSNLARFDGIRYGESMKAKEGSEISGLLGTYFHTRAEHLGPEIKRRVMLGTYALSSGYYDAYYIKAQKVRALLKQDFEKAFKDVDVIYAPITPDVAFKVGEKEDPLTMYLSDIYTVTANLVGVPAIALPVGTKTVDGKELPVGAQLMAPWFDEEMLFRVASVLEKSF
jgi:aspartyl-tRNA(Asn)/glutamyl-tRNA(Gln) amidotransferase subunit A